MNLRTLALLALPLGGCGLSCPEDAVYMTPAEYAQEYADLERERYASASGKTEVCIAEDGYAAYAHEESRYEQGQRFWYGQDALTTRSDATTAVRYWNLREAKEDLSPWWSWLVPNDFQVYYDNRGHSTYQ